ncbi:hypothetical protein PS943_01472 [Pseudomonas fluorescens]|uniref:Uncharacterized protein n=1 Tax=Pseudomonas fluorescens TaxID=294 RepID=A0A5E7W4C0_PSEFL|nr:hypothetical protein [Pseudomonas fluorescens]VVQ29743.1 hypothetical protein PS943_01472 [Pseudomonas fluorescens]
MSHQFKPGDLAIIVKEDHPENVGRVVELQFFVADGQRYKNPDGNYAVNASGVDVWIVTGDSIYHRSEGTDWHVAGWTQKADFNLMPLRGDFAPEQQKAKEAESCA